MKRTQINWFFVVTLALSVAGCSTNKTGSNFNLARVNPFQWIKPETETKPYPQKPSSFASPSDPAGRYPETLASSSSGGTLPTTPSSQAYPGTQARYDSAQSAAYASIPPSGTGASFGGTPRSYPATSGQSGAFPTANPVTTTAWQSSPPGMASASDNFGPTQSVVSDGSLPKSTVYPAADNSRQTSASRESPPVSVGARSSSNQYQYQPSSQTATPVPQDASNRSNTDWSTLVGDRYAQLYQKGNTTSAPLTNGNLGETGYTPGQTGYVPGQLDNPPGNINYQPGQTGYTPPGVPPYAMPYGTSGQQSAAQGITQPNSGGTTPTSEYRPGSTKTYVPRTISPSGTSSTPGSSNPPSSTSQSPFSVPDNVSYRSTDLSQSSGVNVPFRM